MKFNCTSVFALCLLSLAGGPAARGETITLNVSGADTATITLTETGNNSPITAISGTFDGANIAGLLSANSFLDNDNLFFSPAPFVDLSGVSFQLSAPDEFGKTMINLVYDFDAIYVSRFIIDDPFIGPYVYDQGPDYITTSAVPEAGEEYLTLLGLVCVFARRRWINGAVDRV